MQAEGVRCFPVALSIVMTDQEGEERVCSGYKRRLQCLICPFYPAEPSAKGFGTGEPLSGHYGVPTLFACCVFS
ncbi:hypothetical protein J4Q44_G00114980 [Coregonus suidteri]|uniref:Uncharacterized protein n=1 Tax=Coregonus suidteri TaxID=861788 RepID=A0AAN8M3M1_9TELE